MYDLSVLCFYTRNPNVISSVLEELEEHGVRMARPHDLTYELLCKLTFVDHVVKEVLRSSPPVGGSFRKAMKTIEIGVSIDNKLISVF